MNEYRRYKFKRMLMRFLVPNWYKNLSVHWSKKEQKLQQAVAEAHVGIGDRLLEETTGVDWGDETDSSESR